MKYHSILFDTPENDVSEAPCSMPGFFADLNLDQIIEEILADREEYKLNTFFYTSLKSISTINFRLEVMRELEDTAIYESIVSFSGDMKKVREFISYSRELHNRYQREKWLLDAAMRYCSSVLSLQRSLASQTLKSCGLSLFSGWLTEYTGSSSFKTLYSDTNNLLKEIEGVKYTLQLERGKILVNADDSEGDYCASINSTFERLSEITSDFRINFFTDLEMCVLENKILDIVRNMNQDTFDRLGAYCRKHAGFLDDTIKKFDREVQFYISYINYINKLKRRGMNFAYPDVSSTKRINIAEGYDMALAHKLIGSSTGMVSNDYIFGQDERIYILTGPNQGGKTTYARAFGQILFLASIGCPVPCGKAELFLFDNIFTHFSVEENLSTNAGRLKEELFRLKEITDQVTTNSIVILNELFATTTSRDAFTMGKMVLDNFIGLDCFCIYVTHIYELAGISCKAVSLVAAVNSENGAVRTYKILRQPADGNAYANSIAEKYNLTYSKIKERIKR